ncbi:MAG: sulfotransferase [Alphaproteobacteria bacterium]|nr:sulfotransferase [Alphaproteobacteria bacterium]MCB9791286.1 sulfotransferase [Alphaproteobacteria bacterium]
MSPLQLETVLAMAQEMAPQATGDAPWGPEQGWRPGLERLLESLREEARLGPVRSHMATATLAGLLASRAADVALRAQRPELPHTPVPAPIFVTGLPRSGTTLLHNLLSTHPEHRAFDLWQLRAPSRAAMQGRGALVKETADMLTLLRQLAPDFARIHPLHAERPDECNWAFRSSFQTLVLAFQFHAPGYMRWMLETPQSGAYQRYREQLGVLSAVDDRPGRLVLKDPCHLWHLDALFEAFPDAQVVQLKRDPARAMPSFASLCYTLQSMNAEFDDKVAVGGYCTEMAEEGLRRAEAARAGHGARVHEVDYAALMANPVGVVQGLCEALGSGTGPGVAWRVEDWLLDNRQHSAGKHHYTLEEFGLGDARKGRISRAARSPRPAASA